MITLQDLVRISDYEWEIPQTFRADMRVPVRIFATRRLIEEVVDDKSLEQAVNAATLPGLVGRVLVMPDMHQGYGFPIGGVAATRYPGRGDLPPAPSATTSTVACACWPPRLNTKLQSPTLLIWPPPLTITAPVAWARKALCA